MARTRKKPSMKVKKKSLTKRQDAAMKRRMLMGDNFRAAHKKAQKQVGK